jgi:hypothetical protein
MADARLLRVGGTIHPQADTPALGLFALDGTTDQAEWVFQARRPATLTRLGFRIATITGTSPTFKISLQGVGATGNPDGVIVGGGSPASKTFNPTSLAWSNNTWHWLTLDNPYVCTRGERLAVVIAYDSGTIDVSNQISLRTHLSSQIANLGSPYAIQNNAGTRTRQVTLPIFGYGAAAEAYGYPLLGVPLYSGLALNSTPDEVAMKWSLPDDWGDTYKVTGLRLFGSFNTGGTIKFYLLDGTTTVQDVTIDTDHFVTASLQRVVDVFFDEASLTALNFGSTYRMVVAPQQNTTPTHTLYTLQVEAAADWDAWPGGQDFALSTRTDGGAWTDTATERLIAELILDDITGTGGGGGSAGLGIPTIAGMRRVGQ